MRPWHPAVMHRTTITFEAPVEREIRRLAAREKRTFSEIVNDFCKQAIKSCKGLVRKPPAFEWHTSDAKPEPWFNPSDRSTYFHLISRKFP